MCWFYGSIIVNLTFIVPAYSDNDLLRYAYDYEQASRNRKAPPLTPPLEDEIFRYAVHLCKRPEEREDKTQPNITVNTRIVGNRAELNGTANDPIGVSELRLYDNGEKQSVILDQNSWSARFSIAPYLAPGYRGRQSLALLILCKDQEGNTSGIYKELPLPFLP